MLGPNNAVESTILPATWRPFANLQRQLGSRKATGDLEKFPTHTETPSPSQAVSNQFRVAEDAFRPGDRVVASATIELLSERDDRVFVTARFRGNPTPIVIDSIWSNCAVCDLHVGHEIRLEGKVRRINHGSTRKWDTASVLFDGLTYAIALPLGDLEPA